MENTKTKRKQKRFSTQEGTYVKLSNGSIKVGQVINISKSGLAFSYITKGERLTGWQKINIFLSGDSFYVKQLPFKVISEYVIDKKNTLNNVFKKQCGGEFGEMTPNQKTQLEYLISKYTKGNVKITY